MVNFTSSLVRSFASVSGDSSGVPYRGVRKEPLAEQPERRGVAHSFVERVADDARQVQVGVEDRHVEAGPARARLQQVQRQVGTIDT